MHLRQLKAFMVVYEEGGIGKAATRLNSTQPGLSVQISGLESELNVQLFQRHPRGIEPTPAGKQLYLRALKIMEDVSSVEREMKALSGLVTGSVSAGITPALGRSVLADVLADYVTKYPNVDIRVSEDYSATLISLLERGSIDFALVAHIPNHPTINFKHIYQDRFVVVSSQSFGFKPQAAVRLNTPDLKFVVPSVHHGVRSGLDTPLRTGQIVASRIIEVNSVSGILEFVSKTDWLALLPYTAIHNGLDRRKLQVNPIAGGEIRVDYYLATPSTAPLSAAADEFVRIAKDYMRKIRPKVRGL
ncbi:MAG: LysR family transcriptional regulator [Rhodospirillaceae bacterium]